MELLISAASAFDFAEALDDGGVRPVTIIRGNFGLLARQVAVGAVTLRADGVLAAMGGIYPTAWGWAEAWVAVGPAMKANLWPALHRLRQAFVAIGEGAAPLEVRAHVPAASVAGEPLARLFGFHPAGETDIPPYGRLNVWRRLFSCPGP